MPGRHQEPYAPILSGYQSTPQCRSLEEIQSPYTVFPLRPRRRTRIERSIHIRLHARPSTILRHGIVLRTRYLNPDVSLDSGEDVVDCNDATRLDGSDGDGPHIVGMNDENWVVDRRIGGWLH